MKPRIAWALAFGIGFLSLAQEVLWVRCVGFLLFGTPQAFAGVLTLYLLGIAAGAIVGKRWSRSQSMIAITALPLTFIGVVDTCTPWLLALGGSHAAKTSMAMVLVFCSAALKAAAFPVAHQLGSEATGTRLGRTVSRVYFLNIVGCTAGPLVVGFWLMDLADLDSLMHWTGIAVLGLAALTALAAERRRLWTISIASLSLALLAGAVLRYDRPHALVAAMALDPPKRVVENRHGILHVSAGSAHGDAVYGGNVYDGRINTDLIKNTNLVDRAYLAAALHPAPQRVLMVGLSGGSWARVLLGFASVEQIDIVELNPGYAELIRDYDAVKSTLMDPRIDLHIDDGRRWIRRNPAERYDLIVMNTTFHWRAHATNLLSREFMRQLERRLAPKGLMVFNATGSPDAFATAASVFAHTYRWRNAIYCSHHDFRGELRHVSGRLRNVHLLTPGLLAGANVDRRRLDRALSALVERPFVTLSADQVQTGRPLQVITDDNLLTEFARSGL